MGSTIPDGDGAVPSLVQAGPRRVLASSGPGFYVDVPEIHPSFGGPIRMSTAATVVPEPSASIRSVIDGLGGYADRPVKYAHPEFEAANSARVLKCLEGQNKGPLLALIRAAHLELQRAPRSPNSHCLAAAAYLSLAKSHPCHPEGKLLNELAERHTYMANALEVGNRELRNTLDRLFGSGKDAER